MDDHKLGVIFELNICSNWDRVECVRSRKYHNCRNIFQKGVFSSREAVGERTWGGRIGISHFILTKLATNPCFARGGLLFSNNFIGKYIFVNTLKSKLILNLDIACISKGEMFKLQNIAILRNFENEDRIIRILVLHCLMLV